MSRVEQIRRRAVSVGVESEADVTSRGVYTVVPAGSVEGSSETLSDQIGRVRRYWWLALGIVVLSVLAAVAATASTPTTYTGRASLIVSSNDRSPDQDAVLVQGYADYFNDAAYQQKVLADTGVDDDVTVTARAAAASPILLIDATASDAEEAQSAAAAVAKNFRDDINKVRSDENATEVASLRRQLDRAQKALDAQGDAAPGDEAEVTDLQDRIAEVESDQVNMLQELQLDGGVSRYSPRLSMNILFALVGGVIIGVLAAFGASRLSRRLNTRRDIADKIGLNTLVEVPKGGTVDRAMRRQQRLRQLANIVSAQLPEPAVVAVTEPKGTAGTATVAWGLAKQWALQGHPTLIVRANSSSTLPPPDADAIDWGDDNRSLADILSDATSSLDNSSISEGPVTGMWVLVPGTPSDGAGQEFKVDKVQEILAQAASLATFVVIEAPPVVDSAVAQVLCAASGRTLLVVERARSRVAEAAEAVSVLEQTNSTILGAVLVESSGSDGRDVDRLPWPTSSTDLEYAASTRE